MLWWVEYSYVICDWKCASSAQILPHAKLTWWRMMECFNLRYIQRCIIASNPANGPLNDPVYKFHTTPLQTVQKIKPAVRIIFSYPLVTSKVQLIIVLEPHILNHILVCYLIGFFFIKERIGFLKKQRIAIIIPVAVIVFVTS